MIQGPRCERHAPGSGLDIGYPTARPKDTGPLPDIMWNRDELFPLSLSEFLTLGLMRIDTIVTVTSYYILEDIEVMR